MEVTAEFELTAENAPAVVELCHRLDGLPLAIELATARLSLFSPQALVERLGNRLDLLKGGRRDAPERQRTLRDTIDWSYELLTVDEQRLFALLSVFSGLTLEAVEGVAGRVDGFGAIDVLDGLDSLVQKSLVRQRDAGVASPRLSMLETIRRFAAERLDDDPQLLRCRAVGARRVLRRLDDAPVREADRGRARRRLAADGRRHREPRRRVALLGCRG